MPDDDPLERWSRDPDLAIIGQQVRAELRAETEADERLAARDLLRIRRLGEVAAELAARGDLVTASVGGRSFSGTLVHAAGDLACLETRAGGVDLRLHSSLMLHVVQPARDRPPARGAGPAGFRARLFEHESADGLVEIGGAFGEPVTGRIEAVAEDHVVVGADGRRCFIGLAGVGYVFQRR